ESFDDRVDARLLVRQGPFLGELEALVAPAQVHHELDQVGGRLSQQSVEGGAEIGFEPALQMQEGLQRPVQFSLQPGRRRQSDHCAALRACSPAQQSSATGSPAAKLAAVRSATSAL